MKVVITGVSGFVGEHVAREFKSRGFFVVGVGHSNSLPEATASIIDEFIGLNLLDEKAVNDRLSLGDADAIIHLAGLAAIGQSFNEPRRFMTENGIMTNNLLTKAAADNMKGRIVSVSTGALYDPSQSLPLNEESRTNPNSPYAVGKLFAEEVTRYHRMRGLDVVIARPFNHIGPGQSEGFLLPDLFAQLQAAKESGKMLVGNLTTKRDYTDVRDIARAYTELALAPSLQYDIYNVCSGKSVAGKELLERLQQATGIQDVVIEIDESRMRPTDIKDIYGDASRIQDELGWLPSIPLDQTVKDFVQSKE